MRDGLAVALSSPSLLQMHVLSLSLSSVVVVVQREVRAGNTKAFSGKILRVSKDFNPEVHLHQNDFSGEKEKEEEKDYTRERKHRTTV